MMEQIKVFIDENSPVNFKDLQDKFENDEFLNEDLDELITAGDVVEWNGQFYSLKRLHLQKGEIVSVKSNYLFVSLSDQEDDLRIEARNAGGAMLGDRVLITTERGEFSVYSVFFHKHQSVVGEIVSDGKRLFLEVKSIAPANVKFVFKDTGLRIGELAVAKIITYGEKENIVSFVRSLGDKNAPGNDITRIVIEENAPYEFPSEVEVELQDIPYEVSAEEIKNRHDFRQEMIVTIDGETARDFDDAVSVTKMPFGYRLGVHIADVSYYVQPKMAINNEAYNRGTSIYLTDRVIPMLPFPLSNGICSLNEGVDRLVLSVIMDIDDRGQCFRREIYPGIINSHGRLTYTYVQSVFDQGKAKDEREEMLLLLDEVAMKIRRVRTRRGSLDLDTDEMEIEVDSSGKAIGIHKKIGNEAEAMIEDLMILANEEVATAVSERKLPMLYRIHELPDSKRIDNLNYLLKRLGHQPELNPRKVTSLDIQHLLNKYKDDADAPVISEATLRSLAKARYADENKGHFGLASSCYTHFTSPIRRYPDLIVHRLIRKYFFLNNRSINKDDQDYLHEAGFDLSQKERRAVTIERRVESMKAAEYMSGNLGNRYKGYIDGITNVGLFVTLENGINGLIRFDSLSDFYAVDEARIMAIGKRHHQRFMLGDHVEVIVAAANKENGTVDLLIDDKKISRRSNVSSFKDKNVKKADKKDKKYNGRQHQHHPKRRR